MRTKIGISRTSSSGCSCALALEFWSLDWPLQSKLATLVSSSESESSLSSSESGLFCFVVAELDLPPPGNTPGTTSITTVVQLRPLSHTFPASATFSYPALNAPDREERCSPGAEPCRASSQTSLLAPMSSCGQRMVTLVATRPGVTDGVARVTRTGSNMWFFKVRRSWTGFRGGRESRLGVVVVGEAGRPGWGGAGARGRKVVRGM